jgi:predicted nuclease of predicted toxin-antitoxin system
VRFLADQDVYAITVAALRTANHDVVTARELDLATAPDGPLLAEARTQRRIFVTRDRDFGGLVFVHGQGPGVIYLRMTPSTMTAVHTELLRVASIYEEDELQSSFVVNEPVRHRLRKLGIS